MIQKESSLKHEQLHFLHTLLEGKREIKAGEAEVRKNILQLDALDVPCLVACISPYYDTVPFSKKDSAIKACSEYTASYFDKMGYHLYCVTDAYDNINVILPTERNGIRQESLDDIFICFHEKFFSHFGIRLFIGIGSVADSYAGISRSALEAMEMLSLKLQYADRGVINIRNTIRFMHYSVYGEDIMFTRVIGRFQDGDLPGMSARLNELIESIRNRPSVSKTAIKRTILELVVNIVHIAANADVEVDSVLSDINVYSWIMSQSHTEVLTEWLLDLSASLLDKINSKQALNEKEIIRQSCDFIAAHLSDADLGLKTVSENVGFSPSYFSQLFKKEKGIGISNYIVDCRLREAMGLLSDTRLRSEDIALQIGFSSATYFGRVFKKHTGLTPVEYRRRARRQEKEDTVNK